MNIGLPGCICVDYFEPYAYEINGAIQDDETGQPLAGVTVEVTLLNGDTEIDTRVADARTDAAGQFGATLYDGDPLNAGCLPIPLSIWFSVVDPGPPVPTDARIVVDVDGATTTVSVPITAEMIGTGEYGGFVADLGVVHVGTE